MVAGSWLLVPGRLRGMSAAFSNNQQPTTNNPNSFDKQPGPPP
jgi:hypothetical protein